LNGQTKEAIQLLEQVVTIQKKISLAEDHPSRLVSQLELARAYRANGQTKEAIQLLEQVVKIEKTSLAEDYPLLRLASQHALAEAYRANGQTKEAIYLLERVVAIQKTSLPDNHPNRLISERALARAVEASKRLEESHPNLPQHVDTEFPPLDLTHSADSAHKVNKKSRKRFSFWQKQRR
jgi:tetratricopeptide (TPR) repeat protein